MPRKVSTPNFKEMQVGLARAEVLYNLKAQVEALYKDALKGEKTPGQEVQELENRMHKVMDAFGIKYGSTPATPPPAAPPPVQTPAAEQSKTQEQKQPVKTGGLFNR